ncbi:hypothetical protein ACPA9J_15515 [Pseudomonas aeruginosa]
MPQPLNAEQTAGLVEPLKNPPAGEEEFLLDLITNRVPPGVDEAAYVKAGFLPPSSRAKPPPLSTSNVPLSAGHHAGRLQHRHPGRSAGRRRNWRQHRRREQLKHTLLMFDAFHDVAERAKKRQRRVLNPSCNPGLTLSGS